MRLFGSMPNTTHPARSKTAAVRGASLPLQCIYGYLRPRRSGNARRGQSSGRRGHIGSCSGPGVPAYRCGSWPRRSPPRRPCRGARADRDGDSARGRPVRAPSFRRWAAASAADRRAAGRIRGPDRRRSAGRRRRGCPGGDGLPCQEPDEGRLAGAVRVDQAVDAARLQRQSEVVEDRPAGNLEADALELEKRRPPGRRSLRLLPSRWPSSEAAMRLQQPAPSLAIPSAISSRPSKPRRLSGGCCRGRATTPAATRFSRGAFLPVR